MNTITYSEKLYVPIPEACQAHGVCRSTMQKYINGGQVDAVKCGKKTLIVVKSAISFFADLPKAAPAKVV